MRALAGPLALAGLLAGCAPALGTRWARLEVEVLQVPVVYKKQGVIISIDGTDFGPRYRSVRVPPGYHEVHAVFIDCPLPMLVLTCFDNALEEIVPFDALAGRTYVLRREGAAAWIEPRGREKLRPHQGERSPD